MRHYTERAQSAKTASGFTLLELLVVMVIIGLLAGYVGPKYFAQVGKSEIKVARHSWSRWIKRWTSTVWISAITQALIRGLTP